MTGVDRILATALLLLFVTGFVLALGYPTAAGIGPMLACGFGAALCVLQLVVGNWEAPKPETLRTDLRSLVLFGALIALVATIGFQVGGAIFAFGYALWIMNWSWSKSALYAVPTAIVFGPLTELATRQELFRGLLLGN